MHKDLKFHLDTALLEFTSDSCYNFLLEAKQKYFDLVGHIQEEDENYESRMNSFNDWYLFQFISNEGARPPIEVYLEKNNIDQDIKASLLGFNHSLFQNLGTRLGRHYIKDLLRDSKMVLEDESFTLSIIKGELFIGRSLEYQNKNYFMNGMAIFPKDLLSILRRPIKSVKKMQDKDKESDFLLMTEAFHIKRERYKHMDLSSIFIYPEF